MSEIPGIIWLRSAGVIDIYILYHLEARISWWEAAKSSTFSPQI